MDETDIVSVRRHRTRRRLLLLGLVLVAVLAFAWWSGRARHAVTASGYRLCDAVSPQERSVVLRGRPTGAPTEDPGGSLTPASCEWRAGLTSIQVSATTPRVFRRSALHFAGQFTSRFRAPRPEMEKLLRDVEGTSNDSCDAFRIVAEFATGEAGADPVVSTASVPLDFGSLPTIYAFTCRNAEIIGITVAAETLDLGPRAQNRVADELARVLERLDAETV